MHIILFCEDTVETILDYKDVLKSRTSENWLQKAVNNIDLLLIDHAHCERKAAQNAMTLIFKFPNLPDMVSQLSKIVREEMVHFERVLRFIRQRKINFRGLKSGGYATYLGNQLRTEPQQRLVDQLLTAAIIEARSCERLGLLASLLPKDIGQYYSKLHDAEARHCGAFVSMANDAGNNNTLDRLEFLALKESLWLEQEDPCFRFHSGMPSNVHCIQESNCE